MFFTLSKVLGFFANPSNLVVAFGIAGLVLLATRWARAGRWLVGTSFVALAVLGLSPIGNALIIPLEQRFPPWDESRGPPDGILVLGGAISPDVSLARNEVALNESAERLTVAAELARRYPNARVLFSGGTGALMHDEGSEAPFAQRELEGLGIVHDDGEALGLGRGMRPGERRSHVLPATCPRSAQACAGAGARFGQYPIVRKIG